MARVLEAAVREYERTVFWEQYRSDLAALKPDADAWAAQRAEDRWWEQTVADGLEAEGVCTDADVVADAHTATR